MKIEVRLYDGRVFEASQPYPDAKYVLIDASCECGEGMPLQVQGGDPTMGHDTWTARAGCAACKGSIGEIVVTVNTMFGLAEDNAVLNGRPRVY